MHFDPPLLPCRFVRRYKRFFADVRLPAGDRVTVHCANTGAMTACHAPDAPAWISDSQNPKRKLRHTLEIVEVDGARVAVNTQRPNHLVREAIEARRVPALAGYDAVRPEVRYGDGHRVDLLLSRGAERCFVEVKNVTLGVGEGVSRFPDAVTARGAAHLRALAEVARGGDRAVLFFCAGRDDTRVVQPAWEVDPAYGEALLAAMDAGVEVMAWRCRIEPPVGLWLEAEVAVDPAPTRRPG